MSRSPVTNTGQLLSSPAAIEVVSVVKSFRGRRVLDDVSLTLGVGESVALVGANGSGKTTLLRLVAGVLTPDSGDVRIHQVTGSRARCHIGYLPHDAPVYPEMRVTAFIEHIGRLHNVGRRALRERVEEVMDATGCAEVASTPCRRISRGYRQRVCIAAALVHDPDVLLLDEPFTALDVTSLGRIRTVLSHRDGGGTVLLASHPHPDLKVVCDRMVRMEDGAVIAERETPALIVNLGVVASDEAAVDAVLAGLADVLSAEALPSAEGWVRRRVELRSDDTAALARALAEGGLAVAELSQEDGQW